MEYKKFLYDKMNFNEITDKYCSDLRSIEYNSIINSITKISKGNAIIAGNCINDIINKKEPNDYDLFFINENSLKDTIKLFENSKDVICFYKLWETENAIKYKVKFKNSGYIFIDFCMKIYGTPYEIISNFDFICVKIAVHNNFIYQYSGQYEENKLSFIDSNEIKYPLSTLVRVLKYMKKGYTIDNYNLEMLLKKIKELDSVEIDANVEAVLTDGCFDGEYFY